MHISKIEIDSQVYSKVFLDIKDYDSNLNFIEFENNYIEEYNPFYVSCKIPIENISDIQLLTKNGFEFIEFQIREQLKLRKTFPEIKPYKLELVETEDDLQKILEIASSTFEHDRFTIDPKITSNFSGERYKAYVIKSFEADDEFLYKFFNADSGEILGFKTHKIINSEEAIMFLGGVVNKFKKSPIPVINGYLELNELHKKGIKKVTTHISGSNYGVLNLEVKDFGYKVVNGFVVLRKKYEY